jgi:hypothetical protein
MTVEYKRMQQLRGASAQWAADDIVPLDGELAIERLDDGSIKMKVGDGTTDYLALADLIPATVFHPKGSLDATTTPPPLAAVTGDLWFNTATGAVNGSWGAPVAGKPITEGDQLALNSDGTWALSPHGLDASQYVRGVDLAAGSGATLVGHQNDAPKSVATNLHIWIQNHGVTPEDFGALAQPGGDDWQALQNWLDALGESDDAQIGRLGTKPYYFSKPLFKDGNRLTIVGSGNESNLVYTGPANNIDLLTLSTVNTTIRSVLFENFKIDSNTQMVAGAAIHANCIAQSAFNNVTLGGQYGEGNLFDALYLDGFEYMHLNHVDFQGQGRGLLANSRRNATFGWGSALYVRGGRIGDCGSWGVVLGGGCGGVDLDDLDLINNGTVASAGGLLINNSLWNLTNRAITLGKGFSCNTNHGYGVYIDDPLMVAAWIMINGGRMLNNILDGLYVNQCGQGAVLGTGATFYGNRDGIGVSATAGSSGAQINFSHPDVRGNTRYGVNAPASVTVTDPNAINNVTANLTGGVTWRSGTARDITRLSNFIGLNPSEQFDTNDYYLFNRSANQWEFYIGGVRVGRITTAGFVNG